MKSVRLLPMVIMAAFALLLLKGIGIVTEGGYIFSGTRNAIAQPVELSEAEKKAAERATQALFSSANQPPINSSQLDAVPVTETRDGDKIAIGSIDGVNKTEKAILERLSERRTELDLLSEQLDMRMALIDVAEKKLAEKMASLEALEARISALVDEKKALDDEQFNSLVSMYETMKPGDAAEIFDSLPLEVLLRVASSMNARKMALVLAKMERERANVLTQRLARVESEPILDAPIDDLANLPQIIGQ